MTHFMCHACAKVCHTKRVFGGWTCFPWFPQVLVRGRGSLEACARKPACGATQAGFRARKKGTRAETRTFCLIGWCIY